MSELAESNHPKPMPIASSYVISSLVKYLLEKVFSQIKQKTFINSAMNPYTSLKVNSLINEMGELIYEQTEHERLSNHLSEAEDLKIFPKDNMFISGVYLHSNQKLPDHNRSFGQTDSLKKQFSRKSLTISSVYPNRELEPSYDSIKNSVEVNVKTFSKMQQQSKKSVSKLINLNPDSKTGRSRTSAFDKSYRQNTDEDLEDQLIDKYRQEKIIEEDLIKKNQQKEKKRKKLLARDEVIFSFTYEGQFVKGSKRQLNKVKEQIANKKMIQSYLVADNNKFWKTRRNKNHSINKTQTITSFCNSNTRSSESDSKIQTKYQTNFRRKTSINKIEQLRKNSTQISQKRKVSLNTEQEQKQMKINNFNLSPQKILNEEKTKLKQHQQEFLAKNLQKYHRNDSNLMSKWLNQIQHGCKVTIYQGELDQSLSTSNLQQRRMKRDSAKLTQTEPEQIDKNSNQILEDEKSQKQLILGKELRCLSNLKNQQRKQKELLAEWEKRKSIKTIDVRKIIHDKKNTVKTRHSDRKSKSLIDNYSLVRSNTESNALQTSIFQINQREKILRKTSTVNKILTELDAIKNQNHKKMEISPKSISTKRAINNSERKCQQDMLSQISDPIEVTKLNQSNKINLNRLEFQKLKNYLLNKNSILKRKQHLNIYSAFEINQPNHQNKHLNNNSDRNNPLESSKNSLEKNSKQPLDDENINSFQNKSFVNSKNHQNYIKKNRSLSQKNNPFDHQIQNRLSKQGTINVNNQILKTSLVSQSKIQFQGRYSILYPKFKTQNYQSISNNRREIFQKKNQNTQILAPTNQKDLPFDLNVNLHNESKEIEKKSESLSKINTQKSNKNKNKNSIASSIDERSLLKLKSSPKLFP